MPVLKRQVNSSSDFASFCIFLTYGSSVNFKLIHFLLWIKGFHQSSNFETFECSGEILSYSSYHFLNHKPVFLQILHHSSLSWKITPLYFYRSNGTHFPQKEPITVKILRISSAQVKIQQILFIFETINQFFFEHLITLQCQEKQIFDTFLAEIVYTFNKRSLLRYTFCEISAIESLKFCTLMGSFSPNHIKFQLKKYRRIISHDTEEWCKVYRNTDFWF